VRERSGRNERAGKRAALFGLAVAIGLLGTSGQAFADSATISVTTTTGASDPAAGVARVLTLSGTSAVATDVWVKYRAVGGAACAPSADADSGTELSFGNTSFWGRAVNGAFTFSGAEAWRAPGTFVFCIWLSAQRTSVATPFTQAISFRAPTGTITATVNPVTPQIDETATVTVTGASEAPSSVFAKVRPSGGTGCAPTFSADVGDDLIFDKAVDGAFSIPVTTTQRTAGSYLLCLWLARSSTDPAPIAGPQPQPFNVVGPPPPPQAVVPPTLVAASSTLRRRGSRYSGRISTRSDCRGRRTVVLRRLGSRTRSFGRTLTRNDGTFTLQRTRRLRGSIYVVVVARRQAQTICSMARSPAIRG
jgi:hypothetical protein